VTPIGQRKTGRSNARWREELGKDARMLRIRSWWSAAVNREERRPGLLQSCRADGDDDEGKLISCRIQPIFIYVGNS
jgi:hypothetical protein